MIEEIVSQKNQLPENTEEDDEFFVKQSRLPKVPENVEETRNVVKKWEWFHSRNLELILESLRIQWITSHDASTLHLFQKIRHYALSADFDSCRCPVTYRGSTVSGTNSAPSSIGRVFGFTWSLHHQNVQMFASLQSFPKWVRSGLASDFYWDLDLVNAHASILLGICLAKQVTYRKNLEYVVTNREAVLNYIKIRFDLPEINGKEQAKQLLNILLYGGTLSLWKKINQITVDLNLTSEFFDLEAFTNEIIEVTHLLWEVDPFMDICTLIPKIKSRVQAKFPSNLKKQKCSFLSLVLQTEERQILAKIEIILHQLGRDMDVFIHDGGLVRKLVKRKTFNEEACDNDWRPFDPLQFNIKTDLTSYEWECQFPPNIVNDCETAIAALSPRYKFLKLAVKPFSSNWKEKMMMIHLPKKRFLRKNFCEMEYFYENQMKLCYIASEKEYHFSGRFYSEEQLRQFLPEQYFINIMRDDDEKIESEEGTAPLQMIGKKVGVQNKQNFWAKYLKERDPLTNCDRIIFCDEEIRCSNMREPLATFTPVNIKPKYFILFKGIESLNVMREEHTAEFLASELEVHQIQEYYPKKYQAPVKYVENMEIITEKPLNEEREKIISVSSEPLIPIHSLVSMRYPVDDNTIRRAACFMNHFYWMFNMKIGELVFVLKFFAKIIQQPTILDEACGLIFFSKEEGVGKSFAAGMLVDLLAPFARETHDTKDVFGPFGNMQENCLLLHLEDADATEMKYFGTFFKNRLTARTITVEKKHQDKVTRLNLCRFLITTNTLDIFPIGEHDRRYTVLQCSTVLVNQKGYFRELNKLWSLNSTKRAVISLLNAINLRNFSVEKEKPITTPYKAMLGKSISLIKRFILGLSLWLWFHRYGNELEISDEASQFMALYKTEVSSIAPGVLWIRSQNFYELFQKWVSLDSPSINNHQLWKTYTLPNFSKTVREMSPTLSNKQDIGGRACLPISVSKMLEEANHFGLNEVDDALPMKQMISGIVYGSSPLHQNLPLSKNRKQISPSLASKKRAFEEVSTTMKPRENIFDHEVIFYNLNTSNPKYEGAKTILQEKDAENCQ